MGPQGPCTSLQTPHDRASPSALDAGQQVTSTSIPSSLESHLVACRPDAFGVASTSPNLGVEVNHVTGTTVGLLFRWTVVHVSALLRLKEASLETRVQRNVSSGQHDGACRDKIQSPPARHPPPDQRPRDVVDVTAQWFAEILYKWGAEVAPLSPDGSSPRNDVSAAPTRLRRSSPLNHPRCCPSTRHTARVGRD